MPKAKISVTIERDLVAQLDEEAGTTSRSEVIERALGTWLRRRRQDKLDEDIERYYSHLADEDRAEDESWAQLGAQHIDDTWS